MKAKIQILLISFLTLSSMESVSQTSWKIDKDKNGIQVFTRIVEGSDFKSFKAVTHLNASATEIITILKNVDSYTKWYGYTKTSKLLKDEQEVQYNYVETIFPWPYRNRDMVYKMSINASNPEEIKIILKGISDYLPEKKGIVRMKKADGYLLLHSANNGTEVVYVFHSEPGDNVPAWLANKSIAELPYKTLIGLRKTLKEQQVNK